jgi:small subunit ribosomal protein S6
MRRYEQIYILRPSLSEDEISRVVENTNQLIIDDGGTVIFLNKWGMRKLAYPIKKELQGYYILCDFAASPEVVSEIERKFRIDDAVLKYLTVRVSDAISAEEISAAASEAEALATAGETEEEASDTGQQEEEAEVTSSEPQEEKKAESVE